MRLKEIAQVLLVSCSILALASCSSAHRQADEASFNEMNGTGDGAQSAGYGNGSNFGNQAEVGQHKLTYYFDYDKSDVREQDKPAIFANADYLVAHPNAKIIVAGHTDPRGSREYNVGLGEHRADAVAHLLESKGVNPSQIRVVSYGAQRLASGGRTNVDFQMDRRAVIVY